MRSDVVPLRQKAEFPPAPKGLSAAMRTWWAETVRTFELETHHLRLLQRAAETWDLAEAALKVIRKQGSSYQDRFGQPRERPAAATWRASVTLFKSLLRELQLDAAPEPLRNPRLHC